MSDIDNLLSAHAGGADINNIDSLLAQQAKAPEKPPMPSKPQELTSGGRFIQGLADPLYGTGQLAEHIPVLSTITRGWRLLIQQGLKGAGFNQASELFGDTPTSGDITDNESAKAFDHIVSTREKEYQEARQAAVAPTLTSLITGKKEAPGIDWWRLGGNIANPMNYLGPDGVAATAYRRIGQAMAQGGVMGAEQASPTEGNYWGDKAKQVSFGAIGGGAAGSLIEGFSPILRTGLKLARKYLGENAADSAAADTVVNDALRAKGVDPNTVNLDILKGMKQEAREALESGADDISPEAIANRAKSESLPIPVRLTRGQATGDPALFSTELNIRGLKGVGEPITKRLQEQNQAFIQNLEILGAKDAPDPVSTSQQIADGIQGYWNQLQQHKDQLYDAVRNSEGLSAKVDGQGAGQEIRETLGSPEAMHAWSTLPKHIRATIYDLEEGKLPLTVSNLQALDKAWGADARAAEGSTAFAINKARMILSKANIDDDAGQESLQAFQQAKQAHAQQMSLLEPKLLNGMPNTNYQPLVRAVIQDGKSDDIFTKGFMGASPSIAQKNLKFLSSLDPKANEIVGKTMMGEIKRQALSSASDERGIVSPSIITGWARDPVKAARMEALLPDSLVQTFRNLADTIEVAKRFPVASTVNTSNTSSAVLNTVGSALKSDAATQVLKRLPVIKHFAEPVSEGMKQAGAETAVQGALKPGVTLQSLMKSTPKQSAANRALARLATPAAVAIATDKAPP